MTKKVNIDIVARDKSKQALNNIRGNLDGLKKSVFNFPSKKSAHSLIIFFP